MWLARDKYGDLVLYIDKPIRIKSKGQWIPALSSNSPHEYFLRLDSRLYPNLTWDDDPIEVNLIESDPIFTYHCYCGKDYKYRKSNIIHYDDYKMINMPCPECGCLNTIND